MAPPPGQRPWHPGCTATRQHSGHHQGGVKDGLTGEIEQHLAQEEEDVDPRSGTDPAVLNPTPAAMAEAPRVTLRQRFEQLQDPSVALAILDSYMPSCPARVVAICTPHK